MGFNSTAAAGVLLAVALSLAVCGAKSARSEPASAPPEPTQSASSAAVSEASSAEPADGPIDGTYTKEFGSYTLPSGWVENEAYSTERKFFYIAEGAEREALPDNISVECGTNRYAAAEHTAFRNAIAQQLAMQLRESKATVSGGGSTTKQGDILYQFTIETEGDDIVTTQYYIVGEQRYVLVHQTARRDSDADQAAKSILDSFVWARQ